MPCDCFQTSDSVGKQTEKQLVNGKTYNVEQLYICFTEVTGSLQLLDIPGSNKSAHNSASLDIKWPVVSFVRKLPFIRVSDIYFFPPHRILYISENCYDRTAQCLIEHVSMATTPPLASCPK